MRSFCVYKEGGLDIFLIKNKKQKSLEKNYSFQEWLGIEKIEENEIIFKNQKAIKIIKVMPINFNLKSELEQLAILKSYKAFLKILNSKIQIIVLSKKTDVTKHINEILKNTKENPLIYEMSKEYIELIKELTNKKCTTQKEFYLILPKTPNVESEINRVSEYLEHCGNITELCTKKQIIELLRNFINKRMMYLNF